jgi:hypothetical protein
MDATDAMHVPATDDENDTDAGAPARSSCE